jgi:hypothetical protein
MYKLCLLLFLRLFDMVEHDSMSDQTAAQGCENKRCYFDYDNFIQWHHVMWQIFTVLSFFFFLQLVLEYYTESMLHTAYFVG